MNNKRRRFQWQKTKYFLILSQTSILCIFRKHRKKGRTKEEVDTVICWLTGYDEPGLARQLDSGADLKAFFENAPRINPASSLIKGVVCGVRVEEIQDPLMQKIRYMDKLIDELVKGKALEKILRS